MRAALERWLVARWYGPSVPVLLLPLAWLYRGLSALDALRRPWRAPCPVVVVGNLVAGGAGKTPSVIALVQALQARGRRPGVVSRGFGRQTRGTRLLAPGDAAPAVGDEPWLIARRTGAPVAVGHSRVDAARALLQAHPQIDILVADDGLQHHALARDLEVWVFDERGVGNGALIPAGPLRQRLPAQLPPQARVLYNAAAPSTPLPGVMARRALAGAVALADWHRGAAMDPAALAALRGREVTAIAGIAAPERFFGMLRSAGLTIRPCPLPDHAPFEALPWPDGTAEVVCTEKDAAKLDPLRCAGMAVWVVGLDFQLPPELIAALP